MALIIEDGSIVENANSYVTLAEARDYASQRGVTLSSDNTVLEPLLIKAIDYLESLRSKYKGDKVSSSQSLQWPRNYAYIDNVLFDSDAIPIELVAAQCQLAIEQSNGIDIQPTEDGNFITEDTIGPITTKYSEKIRTGSSPSMSAVDSLIKPLLNAGGFSLVGLRV